ncbi:MAG: imidazole glycerol phosphate synthase subunit HisH [Balneolaceae bacterium]
MIGILKYRAGNLASVSNALERLNAEYIITDDKDRLDRCKAVIFPGVGHAVPAMNDLRDRKLDVWLKNTTKPVLGICLGMQLLFEETEEGSCETLGIIPGKLLKFRPGTAKIPHMGWNRFNILKEHPLLQGFSGDPFFYYVHSYYAPVSRHTIASCNYTLDFSAVAARNNYTGVQFHPEKSGGAGALLLKNFLNIIQKSDEQNNAQ